MKKIYFLISLFSGFIGAVSGHAENLFWTFDDNQTPIQIPPECEYRFDEVHGGVFMPTVDELYTYGREFLNSDTLSVQQQGAYCILGAAWQGNTKAQYLLARIYQEGRILPQDNLNAYKWAFISALNGNKEAERLTLLLEQYLTTKELEETTQSIQETQSKITEFLHKKQEAQQKQNAPQNEKNNDTSVQNPPKGVEGMREILPDMNHIFSEKDRMP